MRGAANSICFAAVRAVASAPTHRTRSPASAARHAEWRLNLFKQLNLGYFAVAAKLNRFTAN
jgi:hypothetical protein